MKTRSYLSLTKSYDEAYDIEIEMTSDDEGNLEGGWIWLGRGGEVASIWLPVSRLMELHGELNTALNDHAELIRD